MERKEEFVVSFEPHGEDHQKQKCAAAIIVVIEVTDAIAVIAPIVAFEVEVIETIEVMALAFGSQGIEGQRATLPSFFL